MKPYSLHSDVFHTAFDTPDEQQQILPSNSQRHPNGTSISEDLFGGKISSCNIRNFCSQIGQVIGEAVLCQEEVLKQCEDCRCFGINDFCLC